MSDHIADRAGFLAALPRNDPERKLAEEHAHACASCREALDEGARLLTLLRRALPATRREPLGRPVPAVREAPSAASIARQLVWATSGAVVLAWLFQLTVGGGFRLDLDCALVSLAVLAVAIGCVTVLRGNPRLALGTVVVTSGLFAYLAGSAAGLSAGIGIRCTFRELWAAGLTWLCVWAVGRRAGVTFDRRRRRPWWRRELSRRTPGSTWPAPFRTRDAHLLVFHFGGVLVATAVAAVGTRRAPSPLAAA